MQKVLNSKVSRFVSYAILSGAVVLSAGCSNDAEDAEKAKLAEMGTTTQQNAMDVKQPDVVEAPKEAIQPAPVVEEEVEAPNEATYEAPNAASNDVLVEQESEVVATPNGEQAYATCIGCHGANAEGGVGPRLNNQKPEDIVTKLEMYKAGEQVGPMTGMMAPMAASLSTDEMQAIADYVVTLK